jgi:hypothetical protein
MSDGPSAIATILDVTLIVLVIAAFWKVFTKAGRPGWGAIIPIYNTYLLLKISGRSPWRILGFCVPFLNLYGLVVMWLNVAKVSGRGTGFALGLIFLSPIFVPILAFGASRYVGKPA